jgi:anthranilate phosphoribosyltransferase
LNIREAIGVVTSGRELSQREAAAVMEEIMTGSATPAQVAAFLTGLHCKGESDAEIAGMAEVMRDKATLVPFSKPVVDTCGTGGDGSHTFNISTTAAFVVAGAGMPVAKHGNRAMSSTSGSADVLEALGVNIELDAEGVRQCLEQAGIGFMFAPRFHPAMRFAGPVRREIGIRTVFNVLGPLTNPARARHQVIGVPSAVLAEKIAHAMSRMQIVRALVVHGDTGLDELSLSGTSLIFDVRAGQAPQHSTFDPATLDLRPAEPETLRGGSASDNAAITRQVLANEDRGPRRDVVLLNAAAALLASDRAADLREGLELARASLDGGHALQALERLISVSQSLPASAA